MTTARDLPGLNSGETYDQTLSRIQKMSQLLQKVTKLESDKAKRFKTKDYYGQIYTKKNFTNSEVKSLVSDSFMTKLGPSAGYIGFKVYIPEKLAVYPNLSDAQIRLYNDVISGTKKDPKTKINLKKKEWFEAQSSVDQEKFNLIEQRLARFPWFFTKKQSGISSYPSYCKVTCFDDGAALNYGLFVEVIS